MKKRIVSLALALAVLLNFAPAAFATQEESFEYSVYGEEVAFLEDLGFINPETESASVSMTRAEFVTLAVKVLGFGDVSHTLEFNEKFEDVPVTHESFGYIMFAHNMGLINGESDKTFNPDGVINMDQAITIVIKMLGYTHLAEAKGSWPTGYIAMANELKLTDGISSEYMSGYAHKYAIYHLMYNALHTDVVIQVGGGDSISYEVYKDRNLLSEYHHIKIYEGVVTAIEDVSLYNDSLKEGQLKVGNTILTMDGVSAYDMLGKSVKCYAKDNGNKKTLVAIYEGTNKTISVSRDNILSFDYESGLYKIPEGNRSRTINIGSNYKLIYNGSYVVGSDRNLMYPHTGTVTFIDNDDNGVFEIVRVDEFYNLIFDRYDKFTNTIFDIKPSEPTPDGLNQRNISIDDYSKLVSNVELEKLAPGSVISVYKSRDKRLLKLDAPQSSVTGTVDEISRDSAVRVTIGQDVYKLSSDARFDMVLLYPGAPVKIYFDVFGEIAYVTGQSTYLSAYILEFSGPGRTSLDRDSVNMLTPSDVQKQYILAKNVRIRTQSGKQSYPSNQISALFGTPCREFVLFTVNNDSEINEIILPFEINTEAEFENPPEYPLYKMNYFFNEWPGSGTSKLYRSEIYGFDNWLVFDAATTVYTVPAEEAEYNDDNTSVNSISSMVSKTYKKVPTDINAPRKMGEFDVYRIGSSSKIPNVMINYGNPTVNAAEEDRVPSVVTRVSTVLDEKTGSVHACISLIEGTSKRTFKFKENEAAVVGDTPISIGDVLKVSVGNDGYIASIDYLYSNTLKKVVKDASDNYNAVDRFCRIVHGEVTCISGGYLEVLMSHESASKKERYNVSGIPVIVLNKTRSGYEITNEAIDKISVGDKVVIYSRYIRNGLIVVYKEA